jgi:hypothetical protein
MKAKLTIHYSHGMDNGPFLISDEGGVTEWMRRHEPFFFQNVPGRKREIIEEYAGFMIACHTVQFTGLKPQRKAVIYLFNREPGNEGSLCCCHTGSLASARRTIDHWWQGGEFEWKEKDKATITLLP